MDRNWRVLLIAGVISLCSAQFVFASYSLGDSGDAVKDLQRRLTQAGCLVRADGRFNETTVSAVKKFQKKHNLDVDGVVGPVTYKALTGKTLKSKKHSSARKNKMSPGGIGIDDVSVSWHKPGKLAPRVQAIMEEAKKYEGEIYVIGGESIYRAMLPYCEKALVTKIDHAYDADTYFPNLDEDPEWTMTKISEEQTCFNLEYYFTIYERNARK